ENLRIQKAIHEIRGKRLGQYSPGERLRILQDVSDCLFLGRNLFFTYFWCEIMFTNILLMNEFITLGYKWIKHLRSLAPSTDKKVLSQFSRDVGYYFMTEQLILEEFFDYKCIPSYEKKCKYYQNILEHNLVDH
ncbi:hypothetical protein B4U79_03680, partial [Dinothrombium tinctorium]